MVLIDPCRNSTITTSVLGPLTYDLDGSSTQETFDAFIFTPPLPAYCNLTYKIVIPSTINGSVVGDPTTRIFSIDLSDWSLHDPNPYTLTVIPVVRGTIELSETAEYDLTLIDPCRANVITVVPPL